MPGELKAAVTFQNVTAVLGGNLILDRVTAMAPAGGCTAIVGPNGAGKTTLLLTLLGQVGCQGDIRFPGWETRPRIGYVPQRLNFDSGLPLTAGEFVRLGQRSFPLWLGTGKNERAKAEHLLSLVNLANCRNRRIGDLSGGELQRLLLALALGRQPELLLLDEAISAADSGSRDELVRLLERLRQEMGFTQIMISHDMTSVLTASDHMICLNRRVLAEGTPDELTKTGALDAMFPCLSSFTASPSNHGREPHA